MTVDHHAIGKYAKSKGSGFEHEIANKFSEWYGTPESFYRVPASGSLHWAKSMNVSGDVICLPEISFPYLIECKRYEGWTIENLIANNSHFPSWVAQAVREGMANNQIPLLIYRRNRVKSFVTLPYSKFYEKLPFYLVTNIKYVSEVTHRKETIKTITVLLEDLFSVPFDKIVANYSNDWTKNIKKGKTKVTKEPPIKDIVGRVFD